MQMIIELPDDYKALISHSKLYNGSIASAVILNAVKKGIVLPKNHGRLIDESQARELLFNFYDCVNEDTCKGNYHGDTLMDYEVADMIDCCLENTQTILKTDKED